MVLSPRDAVATASRVFDQWSAERDRIHDIHKLLRGEHDDPYAPAKYGREYRDLRRASITNYLPLAVDVIAQGLFVEGYRPARASENAAAWRAWQANGMDAMQAGVHRASLAYGTSYTAILPGSPEPVWRCYSPTRMAAMYGDEFEDEWPMFALLETGQNTRRLYDDQAVYYFGKERGGWTFIEYREHNLGVCPVVRFRDRVNLDGDGGGVVESLANIQRRINETVFGLLTAQTFAAFRQRWATGLAVPLDPDTNQPVEPFRAAVDRLWVAEDPDTKFGEFGETDLAGYIKARDAAIADFAAVAQSPIYAFAPNGISNISAEALAALDNGSERKKGEIKVSFGESWEQTFRLSALASGDAEGAQDVESQVVWADTESRSLAAAFDAWGKGVQMMEVPKQFAWERLPGVSQTDVERMRQLASEEDAVRRLEELLDRQMSDDGFDG